MSSDESEHEGVSPRYRQVTLDWRNPVIVNFFAVIDVFHDAGHFKSGEDKGSKAGAHTHRRLPAQKSSRRRPIAGLPLAAYNPKWLETLSGYERTKLNISNVRYDFSHPPELIE